MQTATTTEGRNIGKGAPVTPAAANRDALDLSALEALAGTPLPQTRQSETLRQQVAREAPCAAPDYFPQPNSSSWIARWAQKAVTYLAMSTPVLALGGVALTNERTNAADNVPAREKAASNFAEDSWKTLKAALDARKDLKTVPNADLLWNNIQAVMHVSDNTAMPGLDRMRREILERGASNPQVRPDIVHGALYTTAVLGNQLNIELEQGRVKHVVAATALRDLEKQRDAFVNERKEVPEELAKRLTAATKVHDGLGESLKSLEERKAELSKAAIPYLGVTIVDTTSAEGVKKRHLVSPSQAEAVGRGAAKVAPYEAPDFHRLAAYVLGQVSDRATLERVAEELGKVGNNTERRDVLLDVFLYARPGTKLPASIVQSSQDWVFGREQMLEHRKALKEGKALVTPGPSREALGAVGGSFAALFVKVPASSSPGYVPGVPYSARAGSLKVLHELDPKLVAPKMNFPFGKDAPTQDFVAKNILLLAKSNDDLALAAASQWFAAKHFGDRTETKGMSRTATHNVLEALAICAQRDAKGFEVLKRVGASYPELVLGEVFMQGGMSVRNDAASNAALQITKALNGNPAASRAWLTSIADRKADLIWPEPTSEDEQPAVNSLRASGRKIALRTMMVMDQSGAFHDYFRKILDNPFAENDEIAVSLNALALGKDTSALESMVKIAMKERLPTPLRTLALEAALYADSPSFAPADVLKRAANESPFSTVKLAHVLPNYIRTGQKGAERDVMKTLLTDGTLNLIETRVQSRFENWLETETALRSAGNEKGLAPTEVSLQERLEMSMHLVRHDLGGRSGGLAKLGGKSDFAREYLDPMVSYLEGAKTSKQAVDINLAVPMMVLLGKANHTNAAPVLLEVAIYPERYAYDPTKTGSFGIRQNGTNTALAKNFALQALGGTVPLDNAGDAGAKALHLTARKNTSRLYRESAVLGLHDLATRYDVAIKAAPAGEEKNKLVAARAAHAKEVVGHLTYHERGMETSSQPRLMQSADLFKHAKLAARFGGVKELCEVADKAIGSNIETLRKGSRTVDTADLRPAVVRSVMQGLYAAGLKEADIGGRGMDDKMTERMKDAYRFVVDQEYWLGPRAARTLDGKGTEVAIFDVGYVLPVDQVGDMKSRIVYPESLVNWSDVARSDEVHPTMVAWTLYSIARAEKVRTYNVSAELREEAFRPPATQDPIFRAFEDLAELQIQGKANVDVINYSFGFPNFVLHDEKMRKEFVDLMSGYMELLTRMDVLHSVAAGNSHGGFPPQARWNGLSEVNSLGSRLGEDGGMKKLDGVFIAAASDNYAGRLAEFSSKGDEHRPNETPRMIAFPGVASMVPEFEEGGWGMVPANGTSFGSPNEGGMLLWARQYERANLATPLTPAQWHKIFDRSVEKLPMREEYEGGYMFTVPRFLAELAAETQRQNRQKDADRK